MRNRNLTMLITGGSRGIGAAAARLAAQNGYDVCISFRANAAEAESVCDAIRKTGRKALAIRADFASESDIIGLWREAVEYFGTINALVNNVGILHQQMRLTDFASERLQHTFAVNVIGTILCTQQAIRHMSTARNGVGGVIVNVSSIASRTGSPGEYIDYAASKAAIDAMTIGLAKEVAAEGIRVNCVRPGSIHTEIHGSGGEPNRVERVAKSVPMRRGGQPVEIAAAILWLASDEASYATGSVLDVAGGL